ncbi:MAG: glutathione S-transferase family protein [Acidiferrobacterales bacterium]
MEAAAVPVITYFPIRGRAEPIRLMLEQLGIKYRDNPVHVADWQALKPQMPFGKVPMFEDGETTIHESHAIYRYLARKYDLYGDSESERIQCDTLEHVLGDAVEAFGHLVWSRHFEEKRQNFIDGKVRNTLNNLEIYLARSNRDKHCWVGNRLTYIDFLGWTYLDCMRALAGDIINDYPCLAHLKESFESKPKIQAYLRSDRRPKTITVSMASFGGTPETS